MTNLAPGAIFTWDGDPYMVQDSGASWSLEMLNASTLRFEVQQGDHWAADPTTKNRSEIAMQAAITDGAAINVSYGMDIEPGATNTAAFCMLGQFHQAQGTAVSDLGPPFAIGLVGERMTVTIGYTDASGQNVTKTIFVDTSNIVRGHYYAMNVQVTFDPNGNGHLVVTRDGLTLVSYAGPLGYQGEGGVYWKEGIYRAAAPETLAVDYANLALTTSSPTAAPSSNGSVLQSYTDYDSAGNKAASVTTFANGSTQTDKYSSGTLIQSTVVYADGSRDVHDYGVTAQSYVADERVYNSAGTLTEFVAMAADGSKVVSDYGVTGQTYTTDQLAYNASGVLTTAVYYDPDGSTVTDKYSSTGSLTQYAISHPDGSRDIYDYAVTGQNYVSDHRAYNAAGTLVQWVAIAADGSKVVDDYAVVGQSYTSDQLTYNARGVLTNAIYHNSDGSTTTDNYTATGTLSQVNLVHADGSRDVYDYGVTGQSYVSDHRVYSALGTLTQWTGIAADGSKVVDDYAVSGKTYTSDQLSYNASGVLTTAIYHNGDGSTTTDKYSASGSLVQVYTVHSDGSKDIYDYGITGQNYVADHRVYSASGALTEFVAIASIGAEKVTAYAGGLSLGGSGQNDTFYSYGGDNFNFTGSFGNDVVNNFHAGDATNHDALQFAAGAVADFSHLNIAQAGKNVVITIDAHDAVTLTGIQVSSLTSHDFLFS